MNTTDFVFGYKRNIIARLMNASKRNLTEHFDNFKGWLADMTNGEWNLSDKTIENFNTDFPFTKRRTTMIIHSSSDNKNNAWRIEWNREYEILTLYSPVFYTGIQKI